MGAYKNAHTKVKVICLIHGEFFVSINNHIYNGRGCPVCGDEKQAKAMSYSTEEFIKLSLDIHGQKYDYSKVIYVKGKAYVKIICRVHGVFEQLATGHLRGKGCFDCYHDSTATFPMHSLEEFLIKAKEKHGNSYDYTNSIFTGLSALISIKCHKHGIFTQEASSHLRGSGCWQCSKKCTSKKEQLWLDLYNVKKENRQFKIKIKNKNIKADGFDPITNTIYEFNGDFWHGNPDVFDPEDVNGCNQRTFGELYEQTLKKAKLIKQAGYNLVDIWEHDFDIFTKERELKDDH